MAYIRSHEDPVTRFAKLMAELYYFMAKEMVEQLGEEKGKEAVRSAVKQFGDARSKAMQDEARERGLDIDDMNSYFAVKDMPMDSWELDPAKPGETLYCPFADVWAQYGAQGNELGYLYCDIDYILFGGFGIELDRPNCIPKGDKTCTFLLKPKKQS